MYRYNTLLLIGLLFLFSISCEKSSTSTEDSGKVLVKFTDDPFPIEYVNQVDLKITKIEIRIKNEENQNPYLVIFERDTIISFIDLRNGITTDLPEVDVPVGTFDLVRVHIDSAIVGLTDGQIFDLKIPSASQSGLKIFINPSLQVQGGLTSELLLDLDLSKSFNIQGNYNTPAGIKGFHFKPVIRARNLSTSGRIIGFVSDSTASPIPDAQVWLEQDSTVTTTYTNTDGHYGMLGILAGTYDIYCTKAGYDTVSAMGIEVIPANMTQQDFVLTVQ
jgi:hypothetical protein